MEKKKLILLVVLTLLALFSLLYGILTPSKLRRNLSSEPAISQAVPSSSFPSPAPAERLSKRSDYPSWGRNPFLPKGVQASPFGKWVLDGIAWDEKSPRAVINDRIVGVGSEVGGTRVVEIKKDRVVLNDGTTDFELRLGRRK